MFFSDILLAVILASIFAGVFAAISRSRKQKIGMFPVFLVFFLFAWAGGLWLRPAGPPVLGLYWAPGLVLLTIVVILLAATIQPPTSDIHPQATEERATEEVTTTVLTGMTFWLIIFFLFLTVLLGYLL